MTITLDWTILQIALVLTLFIVGLRIGGWGMLFWAIGLYFAWVATDAIGPKLERLINKFLSVGAGFIPIFTGAPDNSVTAPTVDIPSPDLPLWQIGFLLLVGIPLVIFVWRKLPIWVPASGVLGIFGRFWGGVLGALSAVFLLGKITEWYRTWASAPGHTDPLANLNLNLPLPALVIGGSTTTINWPQLAGLAFLLIFALFLGYILWRTLKAVV
jgi:hypothetical protein